jgi:hypothetical protein
LFCVEDFLALGSFALLRFALFPFPFLFAQSAIDFFAIFSINKENKLYNKLI